MTKNNVIFDQLIKIILIKEIAQMKCLPQFSILPTSIFLKQNLSEMKLIRFSFKMTLLHHVLPNVLHDQLSVDVIDSILNNQDLFQKTGSVFAYIDSADEIVELDIENNNGKEDYYYDGEKIEGLHKLDLFFEYKISNRIIGIATEIYEKFKSEIESEIEIPEPENNKNMFHFVTNSVYYVPKYVGIILDTINAFNVDSNVDIIKLLQRSGNSLTREALIEIIEQSKVVAPQMSGVCAYRNLKKSDIWFKNIKF